VPPGLDFTFDVKLVYAQRVNVVRFDSCVKCAFGFGAVVGVVVVGGVSAADAGVAATAEAARAARTMRRMTSINTSSAGRQRTS
jgi:hypothetical protein